jgi:Flp pilus assembly protein TadG
MSLMQRMRRFARATGGLAALEFAIILPMMIFLLFGSIELIDMVIANRRVQNVAASVADVISRDTSVSDDEITGIWSATEVLMYPESVSTLRTRVSSISIVDASTARVVWSEGHGLVARGEDTTVDLPDQMMVPGTSIIFAETEFDYVPVIGILQTSNMRMIHDAYRRSRLIDPIARDD